MKYIVFCRQVTESLIPKPFYSESLLNKYNSFLARIWLVTLSGQCHLVTILWLHIICQVLS